MRFFTICKRPTDSCLSARWWLTASEPSSPPRWCMTFAPRIAGLVLATAAFEVNLMVPGALTSIRMMQKLSPDATI